MKLNQIEFDAIYRSVQPDDTNIGDIPLGTVIGFMIDPDSIAEYAYEQEVNTVAAVRKCKAIAEGLQRLAETLKRWDTEPNEEQKRAAKGVEFPTLWQSMLLDTVEFYSLHSTKEAEALPLADWLMVRQAKCAERKFQSNYDIIVRKKYEKK